MKGFVPVLSLLVTTAFSVPALAITTCGDWSAPRNVALSNVGGVNKYGCGQVRECVTVADTGELSFPPRLEPLRGVRR